MNYYDEEIDGYSGFAPSAEDEFFASLEPPTYALDIILAQSRLTQKQLFVLECRYGFRGPELTVSEIANLMGISHQCVSKLIQRALANLRKGVQKSPLVGVHTVEIRE